MMFIFMMCAGRCVMCSGWAGLPPSASDLCLRICGRKQCLAKLHSSKYTHPNWTYTNSPKTFFLPLEAGFWMPYHVDDVDVASGSWRPNNCRTVVEASSAARVRERSCHQYLVRDLEDAMSDICNLDIDVYHLETDTPWSLSAWSYDDEPSKELAEEYEERAKVHEALETIYWAILEWRKRQYEAGSLIRQANLNVLRTIAEERGTTLAELQKDDLTQRILAAFSRDLEHVHPSTFRYLLRTAPQLSNQSKKQPRQPPHSEESNLLGSRLKCHECGGEKAISFATWHDLRKHKQSSHSR